MTKGIVLMAFNKRGYAFAAYNMAISLRHFDPKIKIAIFHDSQLFDHLSPDDVRVFDDFILMPDTIKFSDGAIDPCRAKISMYDYLPYDYNLYLDVDGIAIQNVSKVIDELIEKKGHYYTHIFTSKTLNDGAQNDDMVWAWMDDIYAHYKLAPSTKLPSTNSSIQFIKKCDESKKLFDLIKKCYSDPIPLENLRLRWGGGQPDELYLNVALAQLGWSECDHYVFFGNRNSELTWEEIEQHYYILSIFGGRGFTRDQYMEWYDRKLFQYFEALGMNHRYKRNYIIPDKHANQTNSRVSMVPPISLLLQKADVKIEETKLIKSDNLIQSYKSHTGRDLKITNWFNPSFIDFDGYRILVYRMECVPFCTTTKIGICYLDQDYQPIAGTSKILELFSDLKGYQKGFHVEDPRLFVFNNNLFISYTDGYQMAQAKINPVSLTATESYYINKPEEKKTEKNWTFFEHSSRLYSVYSVNPHVIFSMKGNEFTKELETSFETDWKWGELRGGTSPILFGDEYISFFHSSIDGRNNNRQYFMGAYTFESKPPFKVKRISKQPIIAGEAIPMDIPRLSNRIHVVFPGGAIQNKDSFDVAFGFNDYQCRVINITKKYLMDNFAEVNKLKLQTS